MTGRLAELRQELEDFKQAPAPAADTPAALATGTFSDTLFGAAADPATNVLSFTFTLTNERPETEQNLRCVRMVENEQGFETCVEWERAKTTRSTVVNEQPHAEVPEPAY